MLNEGQGSIKIQYLEANSQKIGLALPTLALKVINK